MVVRFGVFLGALALLPRRIVPFSAHAAIGMSLILFAVPALNLESAEGAAALAGLHRMSFSFDLRIVLLEATVGLVLALAASTAAYGARIGARWVSVSACAAHFDAENTGAEPSLEPQLQRLEYLFVLVFVTAVFSSPKLAAGVVGLCAESLAPSTVRGIFSGEGEVLRGVVSYVGSSALTLALLFALPAFVITTSVSFSAVLLGRLVPKAASTSTIASIILPLILLVFSLCIYPFAASVEPNVKRTASPEYVDGVLKPAMDQTHE